jgi:hypothetical protein
MAVSKDIFHQFTTTLAINVIIVKRVIPIVAISTLTSNKNIDNQQQMFHQRQLQPPSIVYSVVIATYHYSLIINIMFNFMPITLEVGFERLAQFYASICVRRVTRTLFATQLLPINIHLYRNVSMLFCEEEALAFDEQTERHINLVLKIKQCPRILNHLVSNINVECV